jgi:tetratricopeptide (TPR) repeat protein
LSVQPRNAECLNNLGFAKYESRDWMGALRAYDAALAIDPGYEAAWMNKALLLARQGDDQAALAAFRRVMNEADAYNDLGYIHMTQGDVDGAYELFEKAIATSPTFHVKANENLRRLKSGEFNRAGAGG